MNNHKGKIFAVAIVCAGLIFSVWLISNSSILLSPEKIVSKGDALEAVIEYASSTNSLGGSSDWAKQLKVIDSTTGTTTDLTKNKNDVFDDTTVTAQLSMDVMSRYLALKNGGKTVSKTDLDSIVNTVMANKAYSKTPAPIYIISNIKVVDDKNAATVSTYKKSMTSILKKGFAGIKEDPGTIINNAVKEKKDTQLVKLDPIIQTTKGTISQLLSIPVPRNAAYLHLDLLNSISSLLSDLEAIRVLFQDPVRSFSAVGSYDKDINNFIKSVNNMSDYIAK